MDIRIFDNLCVSCNIVDIMARVKWILQILTLVALPYCFITRLALTSAASHPSQVRFELKQRERTF